jgi:hypothetical protein
MHADWWMFFGFKKLGYGEEEAKEMDAKLLGATLEGTCLT